MLGPAAVVLVCAMLGIFLLVFTQKRSERLHVLSLPEPDGWERPRAMVILGTKTGVGLYGSEFDGTLRQTEGPSIKCVRVCVCV